MTIIKATPSCTKNIMSLISDTVNKMHKDNIFQWDNAYPNEKIILDDINKNTLYILKNNNSYLGIITINNTKAPEYSDINWTCDPSKSLVIHRLAVNPLFQKQGVAKKLLNFAESYAIKHSYESIILDTFSENPLAINLYKRTGYLEKGIIYFENKTSPFICFEKILK